MQQQQQVRQPLLLRLLRKHQQHQLRLLRQQEQQQTGPGPAAALAASLVAWGWVQGSGLAHCLPSGKHREQLVQTQQPGPLVLPPPRQQRLAAAMAAVALPPVLLPGLRLGLLLLVRRAVVRHPLIWAP